MAGAFWEDEQDLTDAEQERFKPDTDFDSTNPDGAAESIESASQLSYDPGIRDALRDRADAIQDIDNDPDKPDRFEDDVYRSDDRAFRALKASFQRGLGAAESSRGVESPIRWAFARVDDFAKTVKAGEPDDAEFTSDNDLLPDGHPLASRDGDQPFVEGVPEDDTRMEIEREVFGDG
jgi:hypothetical protein